MIVRFTNFPYWGPSQSASILFKCYVIEFLDRFRRKYTCCGGPNFEFSKDFCTAIFLVNTKCKCHMSLLNQFAIYLLLVAAANWNYLVFATKMPCCTFPLLTRSSQENIHTISLEKPDLCWFKYFVKISLVFDCCLRIAFFV